MRKWVVSLTLLAVFSVPAHAQIAFDAAANGEVINGTSVSYTHTVTGSSALLVVGVQVVSASDLLNTPTYNGTQMTLIDKIFIQGSPQWLYQYALANAPQGGHTLSVTTSSAVSFAVVSGSYTGVVGLPVDNSTKAWTPVGEMPVLSTTTLTPNSNSAWTILVGVAGGPPIGAGSGSTLRTTSGELNWWPYSDRLGIFDSNGPINPAASYSMTVTGQQPYTEFGTVMASYAPAQTTTGPLPTIHSSNLQYLGAFRVPTFCANGYLGYGGHIIAFNPSGDGGAGSLYVSSKNAYPNEYTVAEISLETPVVNGDVNALSTADCVQPFIEPTEGRKTQGNVNPTEGSAHPTGMAVVDGKLWINNGIYYDAGAEQTLSLMSRPLDFSVTGQVTGLYGLKSLKEGFTSSMTTQSVAEVSSDWVDAIGGNLFLSKFNTSIITSSSWGPNAIVTDTDFLLGAAPGRHDALSTPLFYPGSHSFTGDDGAQPQTVYPIWSQANGSGSIVQPRGTSSLLVFQVAGATKGPSQGGYGYGYGCGCSQPVPFNSSSCPANPTETCPEGFYYDPARAGNKGHHGYPYVYQVVAYDMNDLVAAKNGAKEPWAYEPYDHWEIEFPIEPPVGWSWSLSNATYDSANNKIYIAQVNCCDWYGQYDPKPLIHVFKVNP